MKVRADLVKKLLSIGEASNYLGISIDTLRRWEKRDKVKVLRSPGGHRYFKKEDLDNLFGSKYERDELAKESLQSKSDEKTTKIETADTATVTDQIQPEVNRPLDEKPKLVVPRYFITQRPSKYDKLLALSTNIVPSISTPLPTRSSILEPSANHEATKKSLFLLSNKKIGVITISLITAFILLITLLFIIFSPPKIISPIP